MKHVLKHIKKPQDGSQNKMKFQKSKKFKALYLSVAFFFAFFSFGKSIYADSTINGEINTISGTIECYWVNPFTQLSDLNTSGFINVAINSNPDKSGTNYYNLGADTYLSLFGTALSDGNCTNDGFLDMDGGSGVSSDGTYYIIFQNSSGMFATDGSIMGYTEVIRTGGNWTITPFAGYNDTRFISHDPLNNSVVNPDVTPPFDPTSTADVSIDYNIYFNDYDYLNYPYINSVCIYLENMEGGLEQNLIPVCNAISSSGGATLTFDFPDLPHGRYFVLATFENNNYEHFHTDSWEFINIYTSVVNQSCLYGDELGGTCINSPLPDGYSTTTTPYEFSGIPLEDCSAMVDLPTKAACAIENGLIRVTNFLFVPDGEVIFNMVDDIHTKVLTRFPLGYITDTITILSTSTLGTLTPIDAYIPNGVPGTGAHIRLDLTHAIDPLLNATTSQFLNISASSTDTFFTITNRYWSLVLYFLAFSYMIGRIIGGIISVNHKEQKIT